VDCRAAGGACAEGATRVPPVVLRPLMRLKQRSLIVERIATANFDFVSLDEPNQIGRGYGNGRAGLRQRGRPGRQIRFVLTA
jgi:hypothetical protein